jgi:transcriptional regulator with XRE-family HTH domain
LFLENIFHVAPFGATMSSELVPDFETSFGERLARERARLGLTQEALAQAAGITARAVALYEAGDSDVRNAILERFGECGVDLSYLVYGREGHKPYDAALWEKVKDWADRTLVDRRGRPIPPGERLQRMIRAYRWVSAAPTKAQSKKRLEDLDSSRAA